MNELSRNIPEDFTYIGAMKPPEGFYVIDLRYAMQFKKVKKEDHIYIYDSQTKERSPIFILNDRGVTGFHGSKKHQVEQSELLKDLLERFHQQIRLYYINKENN